MKNTIYYMIVAFTIVIVLAACSTAQSQPTTKPNKTTLQSTSSNQTSLNRGSSDEQIVQSLVNARQNQLIKIYQQESTIIQQAGSLKITLYVMENGKVAQADLNVVSGNLKQGLLDKIRSQLMVWDFTVKNKVIYVFTVRFERD